MMMNALKVLAMTAVVLAALSTSTLAQLPSSRGERQAESTLQLVPGDVIPWMSRPQESDSGSSVFLGRPSTESTPASRYTAGVAERRVPLLGNDDDGFPAGAGNGGGSATAGPAWADRVFTSVESGMTGMQRGTQRMRQGVRGIKGRQNTALRHLGRRYSEAGERLARNGKWLGWIDKGSLIFSALGALTADEPDLIGAGQDSANSIFAGMSSAGGARAGGLLGLQYGASAGPWGALGGAIVGTFAGTYFGAELYELTGQQLVNAGAEELSRQRGLAKPLAVMRRCDKLIQQAEGFLADGELEYAGNDARQALNSLYGVQQVLNTSGYGSEIRQLKARALAVLAKTPREKTPEEQLREQQELQAVQTARAAIRQADVLMRRREYLSAQQALAEGLGQIPLLQRAGQTELIGQLRSFEQLLIEKGREYGPRRRTQLAGTAPWSSDDGRTSGQIRLSINIETGKFAADFVGITGSVAQVHVVHRGTFGGSFSGDESQGRLSGGGSVGTTLTGSKGSQPLGSSAYRVSGYLRGGVVNGTVVGPSVSCSFRVPVE